MERERIEKNFVSFIYDFNGIEVFSREDVELVYVQFYIIFFSFEFIDNDVKLILFNEVRVFFFQSDCDFCEGNIFLDELFRFFKIINIGKVFGFDGFLV